MALYGIVRLLFSLFQRLRNGDSVRWVVVALVGVTGMVVAVLVWASVSPPSSNTGAAPSSVDSARTTVSPTPYVAPTISTPGDDRLIQDFCNDRSLHPYSTQTNGELCICMLRTLSAKLGFNEARRRWNEGTGLGPTPAANWITNLYRDAPLIAQCPQT
jgi:hypothetical protein